MDSGFERFRENLIPEVFTGSLRLGAKNLDMFDQPPTAPQSPFGSRRRSELLPSLSLFLSASSPAARANSPGHQGAHINTSGGDVKARSNMTDCLEALEALKHPYMFSFSVFIFLAFVLSSLSLLRLCKVEPARVAHHLHLLPKYSQKPKFPTPTASDL